MRIAEGVAQLTGAATGRLLSIAVRGDDGDLHAGLYGWTWGGCGDIHLVKQLR